MRIIDGKAQNVKIAYIGGGSRGWAWNLMSDLATCPDMSGDVYLYDIDQDAAEDNRIIGNKYNDAEGTISQWNYFVGKTPKEALTGADFVVISILPGTFDEMESDIHAPEEYGIYQSVGDSSGPGGVVRAMRCIPMFEEIAGYIRDYCPTAWVINYTNPMTLCVRTLYRTFPQIRAFGCCHEVFGTQKLLMNCAKEKLGIEIEKRSLIKVNPVGVNHFTWLTRATYQNQDLFPLYRELAEEHRETGCTKWLDSNWMNNCFRCSHKVKFDLFLRYGSIAAAGDRHLAEFVDGDWYLKSPEHARNWGFSLTSIQWRRGSLEERLQKSRDLRSGALPITLKQSGEEGVAQMRAILGLGDPLVTNVNIPNVGQIPNLPLGAVVETNAVFSSNGVTPVMAGPIPKEIHSLIGRICAEQELVSEGVAERDLTKIFAAFAGDPLVTCGVEDARALFKKMVLNTKKYLTDYDLSTL
ncbi:MAG: alpha-glucosidase/alpha-galactosidase [Clostridia bacterium]|nr:alpha-glucosidase/alpha-galactosidase [Clostridia bacterium]